MDATNDHAPRQLARRQLLVWLDGQISTVEKSYLAQTGGEAVCQLHKDGRVTGGLKYDEGQLVALRAVRRALLDANDLNAFAAEMTAMQSAWRAELDNHQQRKRPLPWLAYSQGGLDAIAAALGGAKNVLS